MHEQPPSKTRDVEQLLIKGAHGPRELHVIFIGNGKWRSMKYLEKHFYV
ncbi:MAG: hypothetical protein DRO15_00875 [Thermoprotei archaeon]|nr:MAG: hypothetical protein DRO15_00875 [Thermoprotei archaeon]